MRTFKSRAITTAAAAAIALTTFSLQPAAAGSRYANDAAAFAAFAAVLGTIAVIAATRHRERPAWSHHRSYAHQPSYAHHPSYTHGPVHRGPPHGPQGPWRRHHHR
jgi:hypothetical protein